MSASATPSCRATGRSRRSYYQAIAFHYELPFVDLIRDAPDISLLAADEADVYAGKLTMPWKRRDGNIVIATAEPGPETLLFARKRWGANVQLRGDVEIRHRLGGTRPRSPTRCRTAPSTNLPNSIPNCRPSRCSRRGKWCSATLC